MISETFSAKKSTLKLCDYSESEALVTIQEEEGNLTGRSFDMIPFCTDTRARLKEDTPSPTYVRNTNLFCRADVT